MTKFRTQLRQCVVEIIKNGDTLAATRVEGIRAARWDPRKIKVPAVSVYTLRENIDEQSKSPVNYRRGCELVVELLCRDAGGRVMEDIADELAEQIECLLLPVLHEIADAAATEPNPAVEYNTDPQRTTYEGFELEHDADGVAIFGGARLRFVFSYYRTASSDMDEQTAGQIGVLQQLQLSWDVQPADGAIDTTDEIRPPTS